MGNAAPVVLVVMGSKSDMPVMEKAVKQLDEFGIASEVVVTSAHRAPDRTAQIAREAEARGIKVIIAGAGMAAALPGVMAAYSARPVIGVPCASGALNGLDALYAISQMPPGVPVACVGIDGAKNAAILAAQIIAVGDPDVAARVREFRARQAAG